MKDAGFGGLRVGGIAEAPVRACTALACTVLGAKQLEQAVC